MTLRKSTWVWLAVLAAAVIAGIAMDRTQGETGCARLIVGAIAAQAAFILIWRAGRAAFRVVVRRLTLRLAFSYFLIGIVPIPLVASLIGLGGYVIAHQYVANRLRREITAVGEAAVLSGAKLPRVEAGANGIVSSSDVAWLPVGASAPWIAALVRPGFLVDGDDVWLAVREGRASRARLLRLTDPDAPWMQELADRTGYNVRTAVVESRRDKKGIAISTAPGKSGLHVVEKRPGAGSRNGSWRPRGAAPPGSGLWHGEWVRAFYLETTLDAKGENAETGENVAQLQAATSPAILTAQLFSQGVAQIQGIFWVVLGILSGMVLLVYAAALAVAFVLVGSIARNVNKLTRAAQAVARGDFSVRVNSRSRDQVGDLARSFDGMAASIERLLQDTARKERLEGEIAIARTIQHKLLPAPEARLEGAAVHVHFEPVAEIGGDYYDYLRMPDGRLAFALGDVSGHGLPTGLLVAMAKAALSSLVEAGLDDGELFVRLNELIHRSTDPRHYMTLAFLAYDPVARTGVLTNAGQLAPYRISAGGLEPLPLPSFPLGLFPGRTFPSRSVRFDAGDLLVFLSDGLVEAVDAADEPFGFERFEAVLRGNSGAGAAALREAVLAAVAAHAGGHPADDDRTLMVLTLD